MPENIITVIQDQQTCVGLWYPEDKLAICGKCQGQADDPKTIEVHFKANHVIYHNSSLNENRSVR
jgi:hypothetical protein